VMSWVVGVLLVTSAAILAVIQTHGPR
jgi:hypothetical protein